MKLHYLGADQSIDYAARRSGEAKMSVQSALSKRGYYGGPIDGRIGASSRRAIRAFQRDQRLPVTGLIDQKLLRELQLA